MPYTGSGGESLVYAAKLAEYRKALNEARMLLNEAGINIPDQVARVLDLWQRQPEETILHDYRTLRAALEQAARDLDANGAYKGAERAEAALQSTQVL